jgi:hypothetical protein
LKDTRDSVARKEVFVDVEGECSAQVFVLVVQSKDHRNKHLL